MVEPMKNQKVAGTHRIGEGDLAFVPVYSSAPIADRIKNTMRAATNVTTT